MAIPEATTQRRGTTARRDTVRRRGARPAPAACPDRATAVGADAKDRGPGAAAWTASAVRGRPLGDAGRTYVAIEWAGTCGVRSWDSVDRAGDGWTGAGGGATVGSIAVGGTAAGGGVGRGVAGWVATVPVRNAGVRWCRAGCSGRFVLSCFGCFGLPGGAAPRCLGGSVVVSGEAGDPGLSAGAPGGASRSNARWNFPLSLPMASGRLQVLQTAGIGETHLATVRQPTATTRG